VSEDAPVGDRGDNKRQQHADDDKQDGVVVGGRAVPHALLSLRVEPVRRPAEVIWRVDGDAGRPRRDDGEDGAAAGEHRGVGGLPADVQVPIDGDERHREQRHDTADDAQAGCRAAQPPSSVQQPLLSNHCTFNHTHTQSADCHYRKIAESASTSSSS